MAGLHKYLALLLLVSLIVGNPTGLVFAKTHNTKYETRPKTGLRLAVAAPVVQTMMAPWECSTVGESLIGYIAGTNEGISVLD